jgi:hypothetical protein
MSGGDEERITRIVDIIDQQHPKALDIGLERIADNSLLLLACTRKIMFNLDGT